MLLADAARSLKAERQSHQQTRDEMHNKNHDQKEECDRNLRETNLKLSSLQQHYKLLKSEHDDSTDACAKAKAKQLEEIGGFQRKTQAIETHNKQVIKEKDNEIEMLKVRMLFSVYSLFSC